MVRVVRWGRVRASVCLWSRAAWPGFSGLESPGLESSRFEFREPGFLGSAESRFFYREPEISGLGFPGLVSSGSHGSPERRLMRGEGSVVLRRRLVVLLRGISVLRSMELPVLRGEGSALRSAALSELRVLRAEELAPQNIARDEGVARSAAGPFLGLVLRSIP